MAVLTGIRCANVTPRDRRQVVTSMVPLNPGQVSGSGTRYWTAKGAVIEGEGRGDIAVQATRVGATWGDGSWRLARIHFPADLDAATAAYRQYPLWKEHTFEIDSTPLAIPTHSVNATTAARLAGLSFTVRARGVPLVRNPANFNKPFRNPLQAVEHSVTFTPDAGAIPDYHAPYTVSNTAKAEQADTAGLSATWIRAYRVSGRILPERSGGSATEPSIVGTMVYEVASDASGVGRFVRFWFEAANSLCTDDADPRDATTVEYELQQDITLDVECSTGQVIVVVDTSAGYTQSAPVATANGYRVQVYAHEPVPGRNDWVFPHLMGAHLRGYLIFPGGLSASELSTRNAIQYQDGDQAFVEGVATTWASTQSYGAFGVVHRPEDVFHTSIGNWRDQIASEALNQLGRMRQASRGGQYNFFPSYTQNPATNGGSATPAFGGSLLGMYASTAHPDLRAVYLSAKLDVQRPMNARNNAGDVFDCSAELARPSGLAAGTDSAVAMYDGQPWWLDFGQQRYGKGPALDALSSIPRALDGGNAGNVSAYDNLHMEMGCPIFYAYLTADRYFLDRFCHGLKEVALATVPNALNYDDYDLGAGIVWNNSGVVMNGVPRGHGRPLKMKAHLYLLTGDSSMEAHIAAKLERMHEWATLGIPQDGQPAGINVAVAHVLRDNSLFPTAFAQVNGACSTGAQVWSNPGQTSWIPWQNALLCEGIYACCRAIQHLPAYATEVAKGLEVAAKLGKAILLHGYRPRGTEFGSMFGIDLLHNPSSLGDAPDWPWDPTTRYCAENGNIPGTSGSSFLDDPYGPLNPDRGNVPFYRDNPSGSFVFSTLPGALIGAYLNPGDAAVQAAIAQKLTTRKVFASGNPDIVRSGASAASFPSAWHQIANVIPQPFTRWVSGPVTYQASATIPIDALPTINANATVTRIYQASASIAMDALPTIVANGDRIDPIYQASVTIPVDALPTIAANPSFARTIQASVSIPVDALPTVAVGVITRTDSAAEDPVDIDGGGGGGGDGGGSGNQNRDRKQTVYDALGPNLMRARGVKLFRGAGGFPVRVTIPRTYRGTPKREWWW